MEPALVFLHCWGGTSRTWRKVTAEPEGQFKAMAYDARPCLISFISHPLAGAILMPLVWCSSSDPLERPREVALICETCCHSHHGRALSFHQQ